MATNKHATIRYHALDKCFGNFGRRYYIEDLIEACNNAIYEFSGSVDGIKRRQIFDDLIFMESDQGWSIPLDRIKDGRRVYYRYSEKSYSIKNQPINESEANQLKETLSLLTRFKGMPQFEWMDELLVRIETAFNLKHSNSVIVGFEQNPYLKGLNFFTELFNATRYKRVLEISYQGFKQETPSTLLIHPYYLKQYNSRWFLFGRNEGFDGITNLALDRIISITETDKPFAENNLVDFTEYFEDVIGVTVNENKAVEKILLKIDKQLWPYIETKPIHGSQKVKEVTDENIKIELNLQINYELVSTIFSLGEGVQVIAPEELIFIMKGKAESLFTKYI